MPFARDTLLSDSYFRVINDITLFMTCDWGLDAFVFALVSYMITVYLSNHTCKHGSFRERTSLFSFFIFRQKIKELINIPSCQSSHHRYLSIWFRTIWYGTIKATFLTTYHASGEVCCVCFFASLVIIMPSHTS